MNVIEQIRVVDTDQINLVFFDLMWKTLRIFYVVLTLVSVEDIGVLIYLVKYVYAMWLDIGDF